MNTENAQLGPNILALSVEEEESRRRGESGVFKDRTNKLRNQRRVRNLDKRQVGVEEKVEENKHQSGPGELQEGKNQKCQEQKENENIFLNFDSQNSLHSDQKIQSQHEVQQKDEEENSEVNCQGAEDMFLLDFGSEELLQGSEQKQEKCQKRYSVDTPMTQENSAGKIDYPQNIDEAFLLNLSEEEKGSQYEQQQSSSSSSQQSQVNNSRSFHKHILTLSELINEHKDKYYLKAITEGKTFQCVMKRQKNQMYTRYHLYDSQTLRNFMTIIKNDDYLVISRFQSESCKHLSDSNRKQRVIGRISSNFFGTEFNCSLEDKPYKGDSSFPAPSKRQNIMTIQYQTNLFGLKGPRKMAAFVGSEAYSVPLNQVYKSQQQYKKVRTVSKFRNKIPKWSDETGSYVLNFYGRASVSSIKNFVMIGVDENESALPRVLFGKFGKQLFNLDIRGPLNILQGLSLAISSFDRKLVCQ